MLLIEKLTISKTKKFVNLNYFKIIFFLDLFIFKWIFNELRTFFFFSNSKFSLHHSPVIIIFFEFLEYFFRSIGEVDYLMSSIIFLVFFIEFIKDPESFILPFSIKYILSQCFNVFILCEIIIIVLLLREFISLRISFSVKVSNALVASSKMRISGLKIKALAIPILWISPPEKFIPLSLIL